MAKKKQTVLTTVFDGVVLDKHCKYCQGTGAMTGMPDGNCPHCGGTGLVLTDSGNALMVFLRRHLVIETKLSHQ